MSCALLVLSPHLDDAVLGCAGLLVTYPGARVVTLLAGFPPRGSISADWDTSCGFGSASEAVAARRCEDGKALRLLGAEPVWLDFCDGQYGDLPSLEDLRDAVLDQIAQHCPVEVAMPLGLFHVDHILSARACIAAMRQSGAQGLRWMCYEDGLYRSLPGIVHERLRCLEDEGIHPLPHFLSISAASAKRKAMACYASQLEALGEAGFDWRLELDTLERYWLMEPTNSELLVKPA